MKGLLLKDWYMMKQYCRSYLLIAIGFIALSLIGNDNLFFVFYPCLLCGMIPVNLLGYDERSRWIPYSGTMPYTKKQIVSGKYLIGLLAQLTVFIVMGAAQAVKMVTAGAFILGDFAVLMGLLFIVSIIASAIPLPFVFKWGVEKGRMAYYVMIGFVCGASVLASTYYKGQLGIEMKSAFLLTVLAAAGIGIYTFSWYMSIGFYEKREIQ